MGSWNYLTVLAPIGILLLKALINLSTVTPFNAPLVFRYKGKLALTFMRFSVSLLR
jgi:hypothetical protein